MHGCESRHVESVPVVEKFEGKVAWVGMVEVFDLIGHSKANGHMHGRTATATKTRQSLCYKFRL
jgi:hypothetical protein